METIIVQQGKGRIMFRTMDYGTKFGVGAWKKQCRSHWFSHKVIDTDN